MAASVWPAVKQTDTASSPVEYNVGLCQSFYTVINRNGLTAYSVTSIVTIADRYPISIDATDNN